MARQYPELGVDAATADLAIGALHVLQEAHSTLEADLERHDGAWAELTQTLAVNQPCSVALAQDMHGWPAIEMDWKFEDTAAEASKLSVSATVSISELPRAAGEIEGAIRELAMPQSTLLPNETPLLGIDKQRRGFNWNYSRTALLAKLLDEVEPAMSEARIVGLGHDLIVGPDAYAVLRARQSLGYLGSRALKDPFATEPADYLLEYAGDALDADVQTPMGLRDFLTKQVCEPFARYMGQVTYIADWLHSSTVAPTLIEQTFKAS